MTIVEIKETMKKKKITYRLLASFLGISYGYLHDMLNGRRNIGNYKKKIERVFEEWEEIKIDFQMKQ